MLRKAILFGAALGLAFAANAATPDTQATSGQTQTAVTAVPTLAAAKTAPMKTMKVATQEKTNINTADAATLGKVKCIGPKRAAEIVKYREANGDFKALEDLQKVKGFKKAHIDRLSKHLTI